MFGFLKKKKKPLIGMDIGSNVVKCLRLEMEEDTPRITNFGMVSLPPEAIVDGEIMDRELVIQAIMDCAEEANLPEEPVASAVSGRAVIVKKIVMDKMSRDDAREAIFWEAEQHVPFDIDDITLDFEILQEDIGANQMEMLLVAAKKDMILTHAELIRDAGFQPAVIDVASFANQNSWEFTCATVQEIENEEALESVEQNDLEETEELNNDEISESVSADEDNPEESSENEDKYAGEFVALLDVGGGVTNVHIVKEGIPHFTRDLPIGTSNFIEEFQKQMGLSYEVAQAVAQGHTEGVDEQLIKEIVESVGSDIFQGLEPSLSYLKTSGEAEGINRIILCGGGAKMPGLLDYLADCYSVPSDLINPLMGIEYDSEVFGEHDPEELNTMLSVCVGLALRKEGA